MIDGSSFNGGGVSLFHCRSSGGKANISILYVIFSIFDQSFVHSHLMFIAALLFISISLIDVLIFNIVLYVDIFAGDLLYHVIFTFIYAL